MYETLQSYSISTGFKKELMRSLEDIFSQMKWRIILVIMVS